MLRSTSSGKRPLIILIIILVSAVSSKIFASSPVSVPVNDEVYVFLERMETLGYVHDLLDGIRPFSRGRIARFLLEIKESRDELTHIDRRRLDDYLLDYRYEIDSSQKYARLEEDKKWYSPLGR
ncbi:MAG TPA: hypothetical protein EYP36_00030, partial [Calditrichaeota bacterium]|nr:hypothetical protein [Calditrichota bacterium]